MKKIRDEYLKKRERFLYYKYIRNIISICSVRANSILDVGSGSVDVISHLNADVKYSLDYEYPLYKDGIVSVTGDFLKWEPTMTFDVVCCFQVIEHIKDAKLFCEKLLALANDTVIVSVPYMWDEDACPEHVQDPINIDKLIGWFGLEPTFCEICDRRLIAVFLKDRTVCSRLKEKNGSGFTVFYDRYLKESSKLEWKVPFEKLLEGNRILLYGAGKLGKRYFEQLKNRNDYDVVCWVDKNYQKKQQEGLDVKSLEFINQVDFDYVLLGVMEEKSVKAIKNYLINECCIAEDKIIWNWA